jgi:hypothetical protein
MEVLSVIIIGIFGILNIVLFFKIWAMTNNIIKILSFLKATRTDLEWDDWAESFVSNKGYSRRLK